MKYAVIQDLRKCHKILVGAVNLWSYYYFDNFSVVSRTLQEKSASCLLEDYSGFYFGLIHETTPFPSLY